MRESQNCGLFSVSSKELHFISFLYPNILLITIYNFYIGPGAGTYEVVELEEGMEPDDEVAGPEGIIDGIEEGADEGIIDGMEEGADEGIIDGIEVVEGIIDGAEGIIEGIVEGIEGIEGVEGIIDGIEEVTGPEEGIIDGAEGIIEGIIEGIEGVEGAKGIDGIMRLAGGAGGAGGAGTGTGTGGLTSKLSSSPEIDLENVYPITSDIPFIAIFII